MGEYPTLESVVQGEETPINSMYIMALSLLLEGTYPFTVMGEMEAHEKVIELAKQAIAMKYNG